MEGDNGVETERIQEELGLIQENINTLLDEHKKWNKKVDKVRGVDFPIDAGGTANAMQEYKTLLMEARLELFTHTQGLLKSIKISMGNIQNNLE